MAEPTITTEEKKKRAQGNLPDGSTVSPVPGMASITPPVTATPEQQSLNKLSDNLNSFRQQTVSPEVANNPVTTSMRNAGVQVPTDMGTAPVKGYEDNQTKVINLKPLPQYPEKVTPNLTVASNSGIPVSNKLPETAEVTGTTAGIPVSNKLPETAEFITPIKEPTPATTPVDAGPTQKDKDRFRILTGTNYNERSKADQASMQQLRGTKEVPAFVKNENPSWDPTMSVAQYSKSLKLSATAATPSTATPAATKPKYDLSSPEGIQAAMQSASAEGKTTKEIKDDSGKVIGFTTTGGPATPEKPRESKIEGVASQAWLETNANKLASQGTALPGSPMESINSQINERIKEGKGFGDLLTKLDEAASKPGFNRPSTTPTPEEQARMDKYASENLTGKTKLEQELGRPPTPEEVSKEATDKKNAEIAVVNAKRQEQGLAPIPNVPAMGEPGFETPAQRIERENVEREAKHAANITDDPRLEKNILDAYRDKLEYGKAAAEKRDEARKAYREGRTDEGRKLETEAGELARGANIANENRQNAVSAASQSWNERVASERKLKDLADSIGWSTVGGKAGTVASRTVRDQAAAAAMADQIKKTLAVNPKYNWQSAVPDAGMQRLINSILSKKS